MSAADDGFEVGHTRSTQTKGVWFWGEPRQVELEDGQTASVRPTQHPMHSSIGLRNLLAVRAQTLQSGQHLWQ